jgi:hypothetical protein
MSALTRFLSKRYRKLRWGTFRSLEPVSRLFGFDRGTPIRRYYIDQFLSSHRDKIRGRVLEVADDLYARRFGAGLIQVDVLNPNPDSGADVIGNLVTGDGIPRGLYQTIILTQVIHVLYDMQSAVRVAKEALAPGGVILATFPGVSQISRYDMDRWGDYWRVTDKGARVLFENVFDPETITVKTYGNVLTAMSSLTGLAAEDLQKGELEFMDPDYQVLIGVCAICS